MPFVTFISWCKSLLNKKRMEEAEPLLSSPLMDVKECMGTHGDSRETHKDAWGLTRDSQGLTRTHKDSQGLTRTHRDSCLYFDPFGVSIVETEILDYVKSRYQSFVYSNTCIQDVKSNKCGAFCVSFILSVKNKKDYKKFIAYFNATLLKQNDKLLKRYFTEILIPV